MKNFSVALIFLLACSLGFSQEKMETMGKTETAKKPVHTMAGYLVDCACGMKMEKAGTTKAMEKAKAHTKDCALQDACKASGYGIMSNGKLIKFDEHGNALAAKFFDKSKKENDFWVDVRGSMDGGMIKVVSIQDGKMKVKKMVKKNEEKQG